MNWEPPEFDGGSPIIGYYVERLSGTRWIKVNKKAVKKCTLTLDDLVEGSDCEFRVCAENDAGVGEPSETTGHFKAKDPYDVPGRPDAPEVTEITAESASLSWNPPSDDGGAPITNYIIEMKTKTDVKWQVVSKGQTVTDTEFSVPGLREGPEYQFRVAAENKAGAGQPSEPSKAAKYGRFSHQLPTVIATFAYRTLHWCYTSYFFPQLR